MHLNCIGPATARSRLEIYLLAICCLVFLLFAACTEDQGSVPGAPASPPAGPTSQEPARGPSVVERPSATPLPEVRQNPVPTVQEQLAPPTVSAPPVSVGKLPKPTIAETSTHTPVPVPTSTPPPQSTPTPVPVSVPTSTPTPQSTPTPVPIPSPTSVSDTSARVHLRFGQRRIAPHLRPEDGRFRRMLG